MFQRREYAKIDIVKTEKKGYGLRAAEDMPRYVTLSVLLWDCTEVCCVWRM